jgi:hypothetical protein
MPAFNDRSRNIAVKNIFFSSFQGVGVGGSGRGSRAPPPLSVRLLPLLLMLLPPLPLQKEVVPFPTNGMLPRNDITPRENI